MFVAPFLATVSAARSEGSARAALGDISDIKRLLTVVTAQTRNKLSARQGGCPGCLVCGYGLIARIITNHGTQGEISTSPIPW
jgi:hypothetical protein